MGSEIWTLLNSIQVTLAKLSWRSRWAELWDDSLPAIPCLLCVVLPRCHRGLRLPTATERLRCLAAWLSAFCCSQHCASNTGREDNPGSSHAALLRKKQLCPWLLSFGSWFNAVYPSERRHVAFHKTPQLCRTGSISFKTGWRKLCKHITDFTKYGFASRCWFFTLRHKALGTSPTGDVRWGCSAWGRKGASYGTSKHQRRLGKRGHCPQDCNQHGTLLSPCWELWHSGNSNLKRWGAVT